MRIIRSCFWTVFLVFSLLSGCSTDVAPQKNDSPLTAEVGRSQDAKAQDAQPQDAQPQDAEPQDTGGSPVTVNVMVSSQPPGAEVYADGKSTGTVTDSLIWDLEEGEHILEFRLAGFKPVFLPVILKGKGIQQLQTVKLVRISDSQGRGRPETTKTEVSFVNEPQVSDGQLTEESRGRFPEILNDSLSGILSIIVEPKSADVFIDGRKIEERPISIDVKSGSYVITCSENGYFPSTMRALVRPGKTESLRIKLSRKEDALSLKRLSETYRDLGNLPQAIECIRKAIELEPEVAVLHIELINMSLRAGMSKQALLAARRADVLFPGNDSITYLYGLALFETGEVKAALPLLERAVAASPRNKIRLESLAVCYEGLQLWEKTLEIANSLVALGDKTGEFYNLRGFCLSNLGRNKEAVDAFNRAIKISPELTFKLNAARANQFLLKEKTDLK